MIVQNDRTRFCKITTNSHYVYFSETYKVFRHSLKCCWILEIYDMRKYSGSIGNVLLNSIPGTDIQIFQNVTTIVVFMYRLITQRFGFYDQLFFCRKSNMLTCLNTASSRFVIEKNIMWDSLRIVLHWQTYLIRMKTRRIAHPFWFGDHKSCLIISDICERGLPK